MEPCFSCTYLTYCMEYVWTSSLWIGIFQRATQRARILLTDNIQSGGSCSVNSYYLLFILLLSLLLTATARDHGAEGKRKRQGTGRRKERSDDVTVRQYAWKPCLKNVSTLLFSIVIRLCVLFLFLASLDKVSLQRIKYGRFCSE